MPVRPLDTLLALKAIGLAPGLKDSDRQIGIALIEHFNRGTGRCDPSLGRLAEMTGFSTRTVMRSSKRLAAAGLFRIDRHGGYSNRNRYEPVWSRFQTILDTWQAKFDAKSRASGSRQPSPATCQPEARRPDSGVTQTYSNNLLKETYSRSLPTKDGGDVVSRRLTFPIASSGTPSRDAARTAAEQRWSEALHRQYASLPVTYGEIIQAITPDMQAAATEAEVARRGAGLAYIINQLRIWTTHSTLRKIDTDALPKRTRDQEEHRR